MDKTVVGYFAWINLNGKHFPEKYGIERVGMNAEAAKYWADRTLQSHPLGEIEWRMPLDQLARIYPLQIKKG